MKKGHFRSFKQIVDRVSKIIKEINPDYLFPNMLVYAMVNGAIEQSHFALHFPTVSDLNKSDISITEFYTDLIFKVIQS